MKIHPIDVKENAIQALDPKILALLLKDKTTRKNIIWATNDYALLGSAYTFSQEITIEAITGVNGTVIRPRIEKTKAEQSSRAKDKAEVFTPSWVCNRQNNLVDAKTDEEIYPDNEYQMSGNKVSVRTLNLNCDFEIISAQLDEIASSFLQ